jgi:hypothetical protein
MILERGDEEGLVPFDLSKRNVHESSATFPRQGTD